MSYQELLKNTAEFINALPPQDQVNAHHVYVNDLYDEFLAEFGHMVMEVVSNDLFEARKDVRREVLHRL